MKAGTLRTTINETQWTMAYFNLESLHIKYRRHEVGNIVFLGGMIVVMYHRIVPDYGFSYKE